MQKTYIVPVPAAEMAALGYFSPAPQEAGSAQAGTLEGAAETGEASVAGDPSTTFILLFSIAFFVAFISGILLSQMVWKEWK